MEVFDVRAAKIVENVHYNALNLISPTLSYTSNGVIAYQDSIRDIYHSVRAYKGKIFFLVSNDQAICFVLFVSLVIGVQRTQGWHTINMGRPDTFVCAGRRFP